MLNVPNNFLVMQQVNTDGHERAHAGRQVVLITDLDNTIYNWVDFFAPSFRGVVHALARRTGIAEADLMTFFRHAYIKAGSLEYPASVSDIPILQGLPDVGERELNQIIHGTFSRVRTRHLRLYPGVLELLNWAAEESIVVCAVTNAPIDLAHQRLRDLGVHLHFSVVAGMPPVTNSALLRRSRNRTPSLFEQVPGGGSQRLEELSVECMKPNPEAYRRVLKILNLNWPRIYVLGDSLEKDLRPARHVGARSIWAKYGDVYDKKNLETLLQITPWTVGRIKEAYVSEFISDFVADSPVEAMRHIDRDLKQDSGDSSPAYGVIG